MNGALCGALAILLGSAVLVGWAAHSTLLIQVAPNLAPIQRNAAVSLVLSGLALLGIVMSKPRLTFIGCAIAGAVSAATLLEYLLHANFGIDELLGVAYVSTYTSDPGRMAPATALSFIVLTAGLVLAQTSLFADRSPVLGITGLLVAAVGATCFVNLIWGSGDAFSWGSLTRVSLPSAVGLLLLGTGATAVAWDMTQPV